MRRWRETTQDVPNLSALAFSFQDVFDPWLRNFLNNSPLSREQLASVVKKLQPSRWRRAGTWAALSVYRF